MDVPTRRLDALAIRDSSAAAFIDDLLPQRLLTPIASAK
jgi:hypothetical protein